MHDHASATIDLEWPKSMNPSQAKMLYLNLVTYITLLELSSQDLIT